MQIFFARGVTRCSCTQSKADRFVQLVILEGQGNEDSKEDRLQFRHSDFDAERDARNQTRRCHSFCQRVSLAVAVAVREVALGSGDLIEETKYKSVCAFLQAIGSKN